MKRAVKKHFRAADPILGRLVDRVGTIVVERSDDAFSDLVESIICQQLSDKAGMTIFSRFQKLFPQNRITAKRILALPDKKIREAGPSWLKVSYIKNVARAVTTKQILMKNLQLLKDEAIIEELTRIKGIGRWTAEMFLMFSLGREDVFSFGDLGLRRAIRRLYGFSREPTIKQMENIANRWKPYRSYAARILWRSLDFK